MKTRLTNNDKITFNCKKCGNESTKQLRAIKRKGYICTDCLKKEVWTPEKLETRALKSKQTCMQRYGVENPFQMTNNIKNAYIKKLGVENPAQLKDVYDKLSKTKLERYGSSTFNNRQKAKETCLDKYGTENPHQNEDVKEKTKQTCLEKYGVEYVLQTNELKEKSKQTKIKKYGSLQNFGKMVQEKIKRNNLQNYGVEYSTQRKEIAEKISKTKQNMSSEQWRNIAIKSSKTRSKLKSLNNIDVDSSWEQHFIKLHDGCKRGPCIEYELNGKKHHWNIDFEWNNKLYEIKNPWLLKGNWQGNAEHKFSISKELGIRWYLWNPGNWKWPKLNKIEEFRAKECHVGKMKNPWEAFNDPILKFRAEENLAKYITWPGMLNGVLKKGLDKALYERFTIAKIAPKVTIGSKIEAKRHLIEAQNKWGKLNGVYNPCAGFGGWAEAAQELGLPHKGYDINSFLIEQFNWTYQDLLNMSPIVTDYIVWTSPPVLDKETWGENIKIMDEQNWYELIKMKIKAPHYIFVNGTNDKTGGLFGNKNRKVTYI